MCVFVCMCIGALGLDLSFVRYIFLLEPLADASLEQQVRRTAQHSITQHNTTQEREREQDSTARDRNCRSLHVLQACQNVLLNNLVANGLWLVQQL